MSSDIIKHIFRFILVVVLQVLFFKRIELIIPSFNYFQIFIYPIFILLLPVRWWPVGVVWLSLLLGITLDMFYDSPGVHAGACVLTGYLRSYVLNILTPRDGYSLNTSPTLQNLGMGWYATYLGIMLVIHLFSYFTLEIFTFYYFLEILLRTISSFIISFFFIILIQFLFNPK